MRLLLFIKLFIYVGLSVGNSQNLLTNPSYEGSLPGYNKTPSSWNICAVTPDILPIISPSCFTFNLPAQNGLTYMGITGIEGVGQKLNFPLEKDTVYYFSAYFSIYQEMFCGLQGLKAQIEIWLGNDSCLKGRRILLTDSLTQPLWIKFSTEFIADSNYNNIRIQGKYNGALFPYMYADNFCLRKKSSLGSCLGESTPDISFNFVNNIACNNDGFLYTSLTASNVELHSSLLQSNIQTQKINNNTWKYNLPYPLNCKPRKDTLVAKAYFSNGNATATTINNVVCLYDTCLSPIIPNLITNNGDGKNDRFEIKYLPKGSLLSIYNRWGELIFESTSYQNNWPEENIVAGIYYYYLHTSEKEYKGWVEVVK